MGRVPATSATLPYPKSGQEARAMVILEVIKTVVNVVEKLVYEVIAKARKLMTLVFSVTWRLFKRHLSKQTYNLFVIVNFHSFFFFH